MEETVITQDTEVNDVTIDAVDTDTKVDDKPAVETVPLAVYLELKDDLKTLKQEIRDSQDSKKETVKKQGTNKLAEKYPDVNEEFMNDILNEATERATKQLDEKYTPIIEKAEQEKKQQAFDKAFDDLYNKTISDNPDLPKNIDKELIKTLAVTPKYKNVPLAELLTKMYAVESNGKSSSENDMRSAADKVNDIVSFDNITPDQKSAIMDDPKARQKYFNWLDTQTGR
jgi:hypothetical protein